jgi:hypothetical protein
MISRFRSQINLIVLTLTANRGFTVGVNLCNISPISTLQTSQVRLFLLFFEVSLKPKL